LKPSDQRLDARPADQIVVDEPGIVVVVNAGDNEGKPVERT